MSFSYDLFLRRRGSNFECMLVMMQKLRIKLKKKA